MQNSLQQRDPRADAGSSWEVRMLGFQRLLKVYQQWLADNQRPSASRYQQLYRQYFSQPEWADRRARDITRHDLLYFKQCYEATPAQCNKAISFVKQAYNWANDRIDPETRQPYYDGPNPAIRVQKCATYSRERQMDEREIRILLANLEDYSPHYEAFFVARLLTPCRIKELCEVKWADVDWTTGKWTKKLTKNGRSHAILIPRQALTFMQRLPQTCAYVFPGHYGQPWRTCSAQKAWATVRKECKLPADLQLLDFRRTLASYLYTEIEADELTAKAVLNHYDGRSVAVYTRLNYDHLAAIVQRYADWIWQLKAEQPQLALA